MSAVFEKFANICFTEWNLAYEQFAVCPVSTLRTPIDNVCMCVLKYFAHLYCALFSV